MVLAEAAFALACFGEDIGAMLSLVDRALTFNPSYARGWYISGFLQLWAGHTHLAIEHAETALRLVVLARKSARILVNRRRAVLQPAFCRSCSETAHRDRGQFELPNLVPVPCRLLCPYGAARRGATND